MTSNDILLILTWVVGIFGAIATAYFARRRYRAEAQKLLDEASFKAAKDAVDLLREETAHLKKELNAVRGDLAAMRAREGKLFKRIGMLESILMQNNITVPDGDIV